MSELHTQFCQNLFQFTICFCSINHKYVIFMPIFMSIFKWNTIIYHIVNSSFNLDHYIPHCENQFNLNTSSVHIIDVRRKTIFRSTCANISLFFLILSVVACLLILFVTTILHKSFQLVSVILHLSSSPSV